MQNKNLSGHTVLYAFLRVIISMVIRSIYRIKVTGKENIPESGPALLICNHISYLDGLILGLSTKRRVSFMLDQSFYNMTLLNWFFRLTNAIPVSAKNRRNVIESIEKSRDKLLQGNLVCVFAEGMITRTGNILSFKRGFKKIADGLDVPIIPVHLDRLWGSIFSFRGGRFLWKRPRKIPYPVTVSFGRKMPSTSEIFEIRQAIAELGSEAAEFKKNQKDLLHLRFIQTAKRFWFSFCIADTTGKELTFGKTLIGSILLARWLKSTKREEQMVGILLPPSVGGAITNIAFLLAGKTPVNLNFTIGYAAMDSAIKQCNIQTILTSRIFLKKAGLKELKGMVFLEDVMKQVTWFQKISAAVLAFILPPRLLLSLCGGRDQDTDSLATVVFSSGTTGIPKGVMLSHHNIISNINAVSELFSLTKKDRMMGILPFFHSFGFTFTLWFPLLLGFGTVYHPNPLDAKTIGKTIFTHKATILISTPTFYAAYIKKCPTEHFSSLRFAIVGSEKLKDTLAKSFKEKYGLDLLEGYGCTEMSPVVSINIPDIKQKDIRQTGLKFGTVGHPIPGIALRIVCPDSGVLLPHDKEGLLLVKGPNRMVGYLGNPEKTAEVLREGWYVTGDIASVDGDGFITITDRLSRFSKIGGEMVPHIKIEGAINSIIKDSVSVVTAIPDETRGERLVVLHSSKASSTEEIWNRLAKTDLPHLWLPKRENIYYIEAIPLLGTGKVDLITAKMIALKNVKG